jgi:hypothetical protein
MSDPHRQQRRRKRAERDPQEQEAIDRALRQVAALRRLKGRETVRAAPELATMKHGSNRFEKKVEGQNCPSTPETGHELSLQRAAIAAEGQAVTEA